MREHHAEGDHGNPLSDDVIDEEVAATGQRCAHQAGNTSCSTHTHTHVTMLIMIMGLAATFDTTIMKHMVIGS